MAVVADAVEVVVVVAVVADVVGASSQCLAYLSPIP